MRLQGADISEQRVGRNMHTLLLNTVEHRECDTRWHIKYKVAFKLNMVTTSCDSTMNTPDYHTLTTAEILRWAIINIHCTQYG